MDFVDSTFHFARGAFFFSKDALSVLRQFTLVLGRVSLAALALQLIVCSRGLHMPGGVNPWLTFS